MTVPTSRVLKLDPFWMHLDPDATFGRRFPKSSPPAHALDVREVQCIALDDAGTQVGKVRCLNSGSQSDPHGFFCEHHLDEQIERDLKRVRSKFPTNDALEAEYIRTEIILRDAEAIKNLKRYGKLTVVFTRSGYMPMFGV